MPTNIANSALHFFRNSSREAASGIASAWKGTFTPGTDAGQTKGMSFVAKLGSAPRAFVSWAQPGATSCWRLLKQALDVPPRAERQQIAAKRELVNACRHLFHITRKDYGVPIAGSVARLDAALERLYSEQGKGASIPKEVLVQDAVARALDTQSDINFLRSGRGLKDTKLLTTDERKFLRAQLERPLPEDARNNIQARLAPRGDAPDSPTLRMVRSSMTLYAERRLAAMPAVSLNVLNKQLAAENDELVLAARHTSAGKRDGG